MDILWCIFLWKSALEVIFRQTMCDTRLKQLLKKIGKPVSLKQTQQNLSKLSIVSSFVIYYSKNANKWETKNYPSHFK